MKLLLLLLFFHWIFLYHHLLFRENNVTFPLSTLVNPLSPNTKMEGNCNLIKISFWWSHRLLLTPDRHLCFRFYHGVVRDTTSEEYYVVSFDDGTYCDNLPPSDIAVSDRSVWIFQIRHSVTCWQTLTAMLTEMGHNLFGSCRVTIVQEGIFL